MQPDYPQDFERDTGGTEAEWRMRLPGACGVRRLAFEGEQAAVVSFDGGSLRLQWRSLPPRRIALMTMPRLAVRFEFDGVADAERERFMRYFDLYMQRGGG
jgi:hypothetical protein